MKKIINFRPLFLAFVVMLISGLCLQYFCNFPVWARALILVLPLVTLALFLLPKAKKYFKHAAFIIVPLVLVLCIGGIKANITSNIMDTVYNAKIEVVCTDTYNSNYNSIVVRNVVVNNKKLPSKVTLYIDGVDVKELEAGTKLTFIGNFKKQGEFKTLNTGKVGYISTKYENVEISKARKTIPEAIRGYIKNNLSKIKNPEVAGLCFAVLFGNKSDLSLDMQANFKISGTAHLLAVSGLHVGFLIALLVFILKICHANRKIKLIVPSIFLILLMILCAFTPSVVRASLVAIIYLLAEYFGKEKDSLSTLSFAAIMIILFDPFVVYKYSFILSFACVFSILCLATPVTNLLIRMKMGKKMAATIATIFCVNFATVFVVSLMNQEINLIGLISNIFLIPLFSVFYMVMFILVLLTVFMPFTSIVLNAVIPFYYIFSVTQGLFSHIPPLVANSSILLVICTMLLIFLLGKFVMVSPKIKAILASVLCVAIVVNFILINVPITPKNNEIYFERNQISVIVSEDSTAIAITEEIDKDTPMNLKKRMASLRTNKLHALIYTGDFNLNYIKYFLDNSNIPIIIVDCIDPEVTKLFEYDNFYIAGLSHEECVIVNDFIIYSYVTKNVNAIVFDIKESRIVFTSAIRSNKALSDLRYLNPNIVYAGYISYYVNYEFYDYTTVISLSNVEVSNNLNTLFYKPLKIKY